MTITVAFYEWFSRFCINDVQSINSQIHDESQTVVMEQYM